LPHVDGNVIGIEEIFRTTVVAAVGIGANFGLLRAAAPGACNCLQLFCHVLGSNILRLVVADVVQSVRFCLFNDDTQNVAYLLRYKRVF
jgi:hypothetical protein